MKLATSPAMPKKLGYKLDPRPSDGRRWSWFDSLWPSFLYVELGSRSVAYRLLGNAHAISVRSPKLPRSDSNEGNDIPLFPSASSRIRVNSWELPAARDLFPRGFPNAPS